LQQIFWNEKRPLVFEKSCGLKPDSHASSSVDSVYSVLRSYLGLPLPGALIYT
jgi:hypothetical protein